MKIDNGKSAGIIKFIYMLIPMIVVFAAALLYLFYDVKDLRYMAFAFLFLLGFFAVMAIFKFSYVIFYAGPDKIKIRFKGLTPFASNNNSIQINSERFTDYQLKKSFFGLRKVLFLFQQTPGGIAKYQGVGLSAFTKSDIEKIIKALDLVLAINHKKIK